MRRGGGERKSSTFLRNFTLKRAETGGVIGLGPGPQGAITSPLYMLVRTVQEGWEPVMQQQVGHHRGWIPEQAREKGQGTRKKLA